MSAPKFFNDCRDEEKFSKPFDAAEIERVRVLQAARLKYASESDPIHPSTYADGRWLATLDATRAQLDAARKALGLARKYVQAYTLDALTEDDFATMDDDVEAPRLVAEIRAILKGGAA